MFIQYFIWLIRFSLLQMSLSSQHSLFMIVVHSTPLANRFSLIWSIHPNIGLPNVCFLFFILISNAFLVSVSVSCLTCPNHCFMFKSTLVVPWLSYSPLDPRFAGSNLAGGGGFFQSVKILSMTSFRREVKLWVPCRRFMARIRTSNRN